MKNTILSFLFAALILVSSAFAAVNLNHDASKTKDLTCDIVGVPRSDYANYDFTWYKGNSLFAENSKQYVMSAASLTKGENWQCIVSQQVKLDIPGSMFSGSTTVVNYGSDSSVVLDSAPILNAIPNAIVNVGSAFSYQAVASDADSDSLSYSIVSSPSSSISINPSGLISFTPSSAGTYSVTVKVTDNSGASAAQTFTITARSPVVITVNAVASPNSGYSPLPVLLSATASGGSGTYTYAWDFTTDGSYDVMSQNTNHVYTATSTATVLATDSNGNTGSGTVTISILIPGTVSVPTFTTTTCPDGKANSLYTCSVNAVGPSAVSYSLVSNPTGMTINLTTGLVSWMPTSQGTYSFIVRATSNSVYTDQSYTIHIASDLIGQNDLLVDSIKFDNEQPKQGDSLTAYVTLENQGSIDITNLVMTMSIDDLDVKQVSDKFDMNSGDKETKQILLDLPSQVPDGYYTVKFTFIGDNVNSVRYADIYIHGNKAVSAPVEIKFTPTLSSYVPKTSKASSVNWTGIWFLVILVLVLFGVSVYLIRKLAKENTNEIKFTVLDEEV